MRKSNCVKINWMSIALARLLSTAHLHNISLNWSQPFYTPQSSHWTCFFCRRHSRTPDKLDLNRGGIDNLRNWDFKFYFNFIVLSTLCLLRKKQHMAAKTAVEALDFVDSLAFGERARIRSLTLKYKWKIYTFCMYLSFWIRI